MLQFRIFHRTKTLCCQNSKCGVVIPWKKHGWLWSWHNENFCSYECRKERIHQARLRHMFYTEHGFLNRDWGMIFRTVIFFINRYLNPIDWLKRW